MSKLTHKQFEEVLDNVGLSNDYSDVLNTIMVAMTFQIADMEASGCKAAPKRMKEQVDTMYAFLDKRGYYDKVKELGL